MADEPSPRKVPDTGYLLQKERRGRAKGRIVWAVAVLAALGLGIVWFLIAD